MMPTKTVKFYHITLVKLLVELLGAQKTSN
jgi:hypothetical protein